MKRISILISRYLVGAIVPYFIFSWLLLSVILFVQQASRFSDIFFNVNIPASLVWQLAFALVPNVIAFTCPMAILVGTVIGLARMQSDSELVAIRAAGVGTAQILLPIALLGILLSVFAFFVNLRGVPIAAAIVRSVALQTAVKKLESPIEPGVFNTEVAGYTIYVKGGDISTGRWNNIFIHNEDVAGGTTRLITSRSGRIDVTDQASELVLENATVSTIPTKPESGKFVSENVGEVRFAIKTRRGELIDKLSSSVGTPEEFGLSQLAEYAATKDGRERVEANILWYRRIVLSITPFLFCLLGAAMMLRLNRGSRGYAIALAFAGLIGYYLLTFGGEQLARTGSIPPILGALLGPIATVVTIIYLSIVRPSSSGRFRLIDHAAILLSKLKPESAKVSRPNLFVGLTTGLKDFDIASNLAKYFLFALIFLATVFIIFTGFELWKFAGTIDGGFALLAGYLFFLLPFVYLQLAPSATLIAILATYVIKSRQNEIVTWISAGQSVYRLLIPCFILAIGLGIFNFGVQEWITPAANIRQDEARTRIRKGGVTANNSGRYWVANDRRIYSFELPTSVGNGSIVTASDNDRLKDGGYTPRQASDINAASDNEKRAACTVCVTNLLVFEFSDDGTKLQSVYRSPLGEWAGKPGVVLRGRVERSELSPSGISVITELQRELPEDTNPFAGVRGKPSQLSVSDLRIRLRESESEVERNAFSVAIQRRYSTLLMPLVIALFTAPYALSLSRKGKAVTVGYAVGIWLLFIGVTNVFAQFGEAGSLSAPIAVWTPLLVFASLGVVLLSKVRT